MNTIKKCCCRTCQGAFKLVLPLLPYRKPRLISCITGIPPVLKHHHCRRVLIVTDSTLIRLGMVLPLKCALTDNGISFVLFDKTVANPTSANVEEARALYLEEHCDAIIGFGGGSSIDCAKAAGARIARPRRPLKKMKGILKVNRKLPLLIAVPTTAGTGSEATLAAVITDSETHHKYPINDFSLIPDYAVLDPQLTVSLPPFITATTGMDALTHAVEAYIGRSTTRDTRKAALKAVRLIFANLDTAVRDERNIPARKHMLMASYYAGCAFTKSYVGYVHAVAHSLGGEYGVPHGLANAVLLPYVLDTYIAKDLARRSRRNPGSETSGKCRSYVCRKLKHLAIAAGIADSDTPCQEAAERFVQAVRSMKERFGIPDTIPEVQEKDIRRLARYADREANPLYPVPVLMNAKELEPFYYALLEKLSF